MQQWCPFAAKRPLADTADEPAIGTPRIFIVHTMVGYLRGSENMFKKNGYSGTESTFGLGGPNDPDGLDGDLWQWQALGRQADAQGAGNAYATSVETSDGGVPSRAWSAAQINSLVRLGVWWCQQTGAPAKLVTSTGGRGFGYHRQFAAWNPNSHDCPGDVRLRQYFNLVIPRIAATLSGASDERVALSLSRLLQQGDNGDDVRQVQRLVGAGADGDFGPATEAAVIKWQRAKGLDADGIFGPASCRAAGWVWKG
jgi:hypothetical protein